VLSSFSGYVCNMIVFLVVVIVGIVDLARTKHLHSHEMEDVLHGLRQYHSLTRSTTKQLARILLEHFLGISGKEVSKYINDTSLIPDRPSSYLNLRQQVGR